MAIDITVPELGESVLEATVAHWLKKQGEPVAQGEPLVELETDKVNLEVSARQAGVLKRIDVQENEDVKVGDVLGVIDETAQPKTGDGHGAESGNAEVATEKESIRYETGTAGGRSPQGEEVRFEGQPPIPAPEAEPVYPQGVAPEITPVAKRMIAEQGLDATEIQGTGQGGKVTRSDVEHFLEARSAISQPAQAQPEAAPVTVPPTAAPKPPAQAAPQTIQAPQIGQGGPEVRVKMSRRRRTIAQRLVEAQQTAAMLTTFNEVDMSAIMEVRKRRNEAFQQRYGVKLGFMSFFVKAVIGALKAFPYLNAEIQGDEIILKKYYDIGVAVGSPEGLVVPVLRDAGSLSFAAIEKQIAEFVQKTQDGTLTLEDLRGGTFTITNGGVFGSLLSTPILTPPQVGILGMHKIESRPVAINGQVEIRPMMYLALTYDHRIVDGREAVQFLVRVKELVEDPESLLLEG